jgi:uncharacterized protein (DUF983 family)
MHVPKLKRALPGARHLFSGNSFNPPRPIWRALKRGWAGQCPQCGGAHQAACGCGFKAAHARIRGAVPLFVIPIAFAGTMLGIVLLEWVWVMLFDQELPLLASMIVALSAASALVLTLLPRVSGALTGLQWVLWMHGFDPDECEAPRSVTVAVRAKGLVGHPVSMAAR